MRDEYAQESDQPLGGVFRRCPGSQSGKRRKQTIDAILGADMTQETEQKTTESYVLSLGNNNMKQVPAHLITARRRRRRETKPTTRVRVMLT